MEAEAKKSMSPLIVVAAIAVIVFCAAGVAAIMGWIPTSIGKSGEVTKVSQVEKLPPVSPKPSEKKPVVKPHTEPAHVASNAPAKVICKECGVIESIREVDTQGKGTGLGAVGGAVVGGLLGNQVGGGRGKNAMTVVGAVGGAVAGNEIEKKVKSTKSYDIAIRFEDGSTRVLNEPNAPTWHPGDKVKIIDGKIQSNR